MGAAVADRKEGQRVLLRFEEAADALALCRSTIYSLVDRGELPVVRVGRAVRIPVAAVEEFAEKRATVSNAAAVGGA